MPKYPQKLIDQAHDLAFRGEIPNKVIAKKLKSSWPKIFNDDAKIDNQLPLYFVCKARQWLLG